MAGEWQEVALEKVADEITVGYVGTMASEYVETGIPFLRSLNIEPFRVNDQDIRYITPEFHAQLRKSSLRPGDVVIVRTGKPGATAVVPDWLEEANCSDLVIVRVGKNLDSRYLAYYVNGLAQHHIRAHLVGAVQQHFNVASARSLKLLLPSLSEQQAIVAVLGSLDDKIKLNRRMNQTLEGMAQAIFKSWFVDFDPVRAKASGRQPAGLASNVADLFPNTFEDSELGRLPKGWKVFSLRDILEINPSRQLSRGTLAPYLDMASMPTQGYAPEVWILREVGSGMKFRNGDTLVARITPCLENGKTAYVDFLKDGEIGWGSTEYIVLRPREPIPTVFAYLLARSDEFRAFAVQQMTGSSGRQRVPVDSLAQYKIAAPVLNSPIFAVFGQVVDALFDRAHVAVEQSRTLAELRDTLLPKLLSGELRVPDAERIVERCV